MTSSAKQPVPGGPLPQFTARRATRLLCRLQLHTASCTGMSFSMGALEVAAPEHLEREFVGHCKVRWLSRAEKSGLLLTILHLGCVAA